MIKLPTILPKPKLPKHLPDSIKWLAGEGAGSWFLIEMENDTLYNISRFSPEGKIECTGIFYSEFSAFNLEKDFNISYPSHCATVSLIQEKRIITLKRLFSKTN